MKRVSNRDAEVEIPLNTLGNPVLDQSSYDVSKYRKISGLRIAFRLTRIKVIAGIVVLRMRYTKIPCATLFWRLIIARED